jgi:hypothetical protein
LDSNKQALKLLGGEDRLSLAKRSGRKSGSAATTSKVTFGRTTSNHPLIPKQLEEAVKKNPAQFVGKSSGIMNRKHRCRISKRHVCDDCSTKRLVEGGVESRVSDANFTGGGRRGQGASNRLQEKAESHSR